MRSITIALTDTVDIDEKEVKTMLVARFYEQGKLTLGQAAELAGYSKRTFMEILGDHGVSLFSDSEEDLENDIRHAKNYHIWCESLYPSEKLANSNYCTSYLVE